MLSSILKKMIKIDFFISKTHSYTFMFSFFFIKNRTNFINLIKIFIKITIIKSFCLIKWIFRNFLSFWLLFMRIEMIVVRTRNILIQFCVVKHIFFFTNFLSMRIKRFFLFINFLITTLRIWIINIKYKTSRFWNRERFICSMNRCVKNILFADYMQTLIFLSSLAVKRLLSILKSF